MKRDKEDNQVKLDSVHLYDILGVPPLKEQIFYKENPFYRFIAFEVYEHQSHNIYSKSADI